MWCQQKQGVTDGQMDRPTDKVISMWHFASVAPQKREYGTCRYALQVGQRQIYPLFSSLREAILHWSFSIKYMSLHCYQQQRGHEHLVSCLPRLCNITTWRATSLISNYGPFNGMYPMVCYQ